jgi:predicted DNA-binding transcriptional regulator AlpA
MQYTASRPSADHWETDGSGIGQVSNPADYKHHRLIGIKELIQMTGDSRSGAYAKMNPKSESYDSDHPVGVKMGRNSVRYRLEEVLNYIETRPRVRDVDQIGILNYIETRPRVRDVDQIGRG